MQMDVKITILSEASQTEKDKYCTNYMWNLKKKLYKWTSLQTRNGLTDIENKFTLTKGNSQSGGSKLGGWDEYIQIIIYKVDNQQRSAI